MPRHPSPPRPARRRPGRPRGVGRALRHALAEDQGLATLEYVALAALAAFFLLAALAAFFEASGARGAFLDGQLQALQLKPL